MSDTLLRRMLILQGLPQYPRKKSAPQLLRELESQGIDTCIRTVQRDLDMLSGSGLFGIDADRRSKPLGWSWMKGAASLSIPFMDKSTAAAISLTQPLIRSKLPPSIYELLSGHFEQANMLLEGESNWANKLMVFDRGDPYLDSEVCGLAMDVICDAFDTERCLRLDKGQYVKGIDLSYIHIAKVQPLGLITKEDTVYFIYLVGGFDKVCLTPLHHLRNVEVIDVETSNACRSFDLKAYKKQVSLTQVFKRNVTYKIKAPVNVARVIKEHPFDKHQKIEDVGGNQYVITFTTDDTSTLRGRLASYGDKITVNKNPNVEASSV